MLLYPDPYWSRFLNYYYWIQIFYLLFIFLFAKINSFLTGRPYTVISRTLQSSYCRRLLVVNNSLSKGKNKIWRHHWLSALFLSSLFLSSPWSHCIRNEFQKKYKIRCKKDKKDKTKQKKTHKTKKKKKKDRLTTNTNKQKGQKVVEIKLPKEMYMRRTSLSNQSLAYTRKSNPLKKRMQTKTVFRLETKTMPLYPFPWFFKPEYKVKGHLAPPANSDFFHMGARAWRRALDTVIPRWNDSAVDRFIRAEIWVCDSLMYRQDWEDIL